MNDERRALGELWEMLEPMKAISEQDLSISLIRTIVSELMHVCSPAPGTRSQLRKFDDVPAQVVSLRDTDHTNAIVWLHGGGYVAGSAADYLAFASRLSAASKADVVLPDYRLAPEHPFPAGLDDCLTAAQAAIDDYGPDSVVLAGDSAGGGLTLATLMRLRDRGGPLPAAAITLSPWADLTCTAPSWTAPTTRDPLVTFGRTQLMAGMYLAGADPRDPLVSPVFGEYRELPPMLVMCSDCESLRDDARASAEAAHRAGAQCVLEVSRNLMHVWPVFADTLPQGRQAFARIGRWAADSLAIAHRA